MATQEAVVTAPPQAPKKPKKKKRVRRVIKSLITFIIVLAVLAGAAFAVWYFVFREEEAESEILTAVAQIGTIQSTVQNYGSARAGGNAAVSVPLKGVIQDVYVGMNSVVFEGDPLFTFYSPDAAEEVQKAQAAVDAAQKQLDDALAELEDARKDVQDLQAQEGLLIVTAPFSGKLMEVKETAAGQLLEKGYEIASLINDRQMRLTLYFSYAYENDLYVGQPVSVSVPSLMSILPGAVEEIHKVSFVSPEGGLFFEVDIVLDNPGALTEGMAASASVTANGVDLTPYEGGELKYYGRQALTTAMAGTVEALGDLRNYMDVEAGQVLLTQSKDVLEADLQTKQATVESKAATVAEKEEALAKAQEALTKAREAEEVSVYTAPISGTVGAYPEPGQEVEANNTVVTITDTSVMTVQISVDDRNISYIKPGMEIQLTDWNGMSYIGVVTKIDIDGAQYGSGMTTYPVILSVENMAGTLQPGQGLNYSFVTTESVDCVTVPIQCVKSIVDTDGNPQKVVFVKADEKPENAVEFEMPEYYGEYPPYPSAEEGYWPVPVETGISDRYNIEITAGLEAGAEIFNAYMMTGAYSY